MLEIATLTVWLLLLPIRNAHVCEMLCPALRPKDVLGFPPTVVRPELGVTVAATVAAEPPVLENSRLNFVMPPLASGEVAGLACSVTVIMPGLLTASVDVWDVWALMLSPVAVTVIVYASATFP